MVGVLLHAVLAVDGRGESPTESEAVSAPVDIEGSDTKLAADATGAYGSTETFLVAFSY